MEHTPEMHKKSAPASVRFALMTVSSSRYEKFGKVAEPGQADDLSGKVMEDLILKAGFEVAGYYLLPDDKARIAKLVQKLCGTDIQAVVISGGTGLAPGDVTLEAVEPLFDKYIPGFGEMFRLKSLEDIGTAAMLSRAGAGIIDECVVFCLPGSPAAVELGVSELIIPEVSHILKHTGH